MRWFVGSFTGSFAFPLLLCCFETQDMQAWAEELATLPRKMHRAGINMRLLGLVRSTVATQYPDYTRIRTCLLLEMIARSLKQILRARLRRCSANSAGSARGARKHAHLDQPELTVPPGVVRGCRLCDGVLRGC